MNGENKDKEGREEESERGKIMKEGEKERRRACRNERGRAE